MSASEKLKALKMGGTEDDAELCTMGKVDLLDLRDVLPQIVAVVEAVEWALEHDDGDGPPTMRIGDALAALDEALT